MVVNANFHLRAVVEAPNYEASLRCPWAMLGSKSRLWIRLFGKSTDREVGAIFAQLVQYNDLASDALEDETDVNSLLQRVVQAKTLVLPGGLQASWADSVINPSCCCGLEAWRDWLRFLKTGQSPWLGHDPSPWVEKAGGQVRVWSDQRAKALHIDFERSKFEMKLSQVQQDLNEFLARIEAWASSVGFSEPSQLSHKFDECFNISRAPRSPMGMRSPRIH